MILQFGLACLTIWGLNWCWLIWQVLKKTKDKRDENRNDDSIDEETKSGQITDEFIKNSSIEEIENFANVANWNRMFFGFGAVLVLLSFII